MKKLLLTIFLLVSSLAFSAERLVKIENTYMDNKGIVFVAGEETPFTGIVENYKTSEGDKTLSGKVPFKDGLMEGTSKLFYSNGKMASVATFKKGKIEGIQKDYYESGIRKREISYKNGLVDGITKMYYLNGNIQSEISYKKGVPDGISKTYHKNGKVEITGEEKNGIIKGSKYDEKGRLELTFTHTLPITAYEQIYYTDNKNIPNVYSFYQNKKLIKEISFGEDMKKARVEYHYKDDEIAYIDYYDEKGNKIGTNTNSNPDTYRLLVEYYYNPMRVKSISEKDENQKIIRNEEYFSNGKLFSKEEATADGTKVSFYDKMGKKIGELTNKYEVSSHILTPYEGSLFILSEKGNIIEK